MEVEGEFPVFRIDLRSLVNKFDDTSPIGFIKTFEILGFFRQFIKLIDQIQAFSWMPEVDFQFSGFVEGKERS